MAGPAADHGGLIASRLSTPATASLCLQLITRLDQAMRGRRVAVPQRIAAKLRADLLAEPVAFRDLKDAATFKPVDEANAE